MDRVSAGSIPANSWKPRARAYKEGSRLLNAKENIKGTATKSRADNKCSTKWRTNPPEILAKVIEHLRVQVIPYWKVKNTLYYPLERTKKTENPRGHNKRLNVLKAYAGIENMPKRGLWSCVVYAFY